MPKQRNDPASQQPAHHQAGEYGEGDEQQATGVGPRSRHARPQVIDDSRGYADTYGTVAPGRYGVHGYSSSPGYPGSYPPESRMPMEAVGQRQPARTAATAAADADERLRELICERLTEDPGINASDITLEVNAGRVTLTGSVDSNHTRYEVEQCVENCGALDVRNELRVAS
jgi:hypothetical protein